ncbi:MAG TPA: hypothetical protein VGJ63_13085 [Micromonosporaceae bacterium]
MLFEKRLRDGIADGSITAAFRRWRRPQVVAGGRYRTGLELIEMDAVDVVTEAEVIDADARDAGFPDAAAVIVILRARPAPDDALLYRLRFHRVGGPDPRAELARRDNLDAVELAEIDRRLDRLDRASPHGPWTRPVLLAIAKRPGVRAPDIAASFGRETAPFKVDVRKLKALGLTESMRVGYRLSERGRAYLAARPPRSSAVLSPVLPGRSRANTG